MIKTILVLVLALTACQSPRPLGEMVSSKIETPTGSGSGFAINATEVLTSWHVVVGMPIAGVSIDGVSPTSIERIGSLDAAVLTFPDGHGLLVFELRTEPLPPASSVTVSGWGGGVHWWSHGTTTVDPRRLSLDIAPGDSGSPAMDDRHRVIGIVMARGMGGNHHTFIVPIREVLEARSRPASTPACPSSPCPR